MNTGKIVQVIGPVVDVQFAENAIPPIYQALTIAFTVGGKSENLTLEVQQHLGGGLARAIAMSSSEGLKRGMDVVDTGAPISVPVGNGILGRILDVTGSPVDGRGPVAHEKKYPIHRPAPALADQDTKATILETGIKVIDLIAPFIKGGKAGAFRCLNALKISRISNNLGDAKSLITHPETTTHQRLKPEQRAALGIGPGLLRLSVGLEDADDLIEDLDQALNVAFGEKTAAE